MEKALPPEPARAVVMAPGSIVTDRKPAITGRI